MSRFRNVRLAAPPQGAVSRGRSAIAVIGIDRYAIWPRLHNAVNDARGAAHMFAQLGFVEAAPPLLDGAATGEAMRRLISTDLARLTTDDSLVVFFAGHGHTDTAVFADVAVKTGYLIPADGEGADGEGQATWLRLDSWLSDIARLPPRHILVIVDACHSGVALSAVHRWRGEVAAVGLDALLARRSRRIITSALDDQRAMDGGPFRGHSLFTGCLIEGLSGGLGGDGRRVATGREIGEYLQRRVRSYPHTAQTPDFGAFELDDRGDMVVPLLGAASAPAPDPPPPPEAPSRRARHSRTALVVAAAVVGAGLGIRGVLTSDRAPPRDASFEVSTIEIHGTVRAPRGLREPWVPQVSWPAFEQGTDALDRQRRTVARAADPAQRRAQAVVLAAMLYRAVRLTGSSSAPEALSEARGLLRDVVQGAGDRVDEITLRLLGACDLAVADYPVAERTWRTLVERFPDSADEPSHRAWLAYTLLAQSKNAEALAAVSAERRDPEQPELAYVAAWARWRNRDAAGAWQALAAAALRWTEAELPCSANRHACIITTQYSPHQALDRDVRWLAGLADIPLEQADAVLATLHTRLAGPVVQRRVRYEQLRDLGLRYGGAGRWTSAIAALDRAATLLGDDVPPDARIALRTAQLEFAVRLDTPDLAVKYAGDAIDALPLCDSVAPADEQRRACVRAKVHAVKRLHALARMSYELHNLARDPRSSLLARKLYTMVIPLLDNAATRERAQEELAALKAAGAALAIDAGGDSAALRQLFALRNEQVATCYEAGLAANPTLAGTLRLDLEIDATGSVVGIATRPSIGTTDLPAVAGCVAAEARRWKLPLGASGRTRIALHYTLSVADANDTEVH